MHIIVIIVNNSMYLKVAMEVLNILTKKKKKEMVITWCDVGINTVVVIILQHIYVKLASCIP